MKIKPGKYFIGDPCYALNDQRYDKLVEKYPDCYYEEVVEGKQCFSIAFPTAYGDGEYTGMLFNSDVIKIISGELTFPVDSGQIGITSFELATELGNYDEPCGVIVDLTSVINAHECNGQIGFGPIIIETKYDDEEGG